ncbi:MAG: hypothetical protein J3Q66DRAFT_404721 [Benniella sp.]|nr:MAG: hypothetical protein J3Q66DRAFT_404721 [Benniella sp.]
MALLPSSAKEASNVTKVAVVASKSRATRQDCSLRTLRVHSDQALTFCFTLSNPKETWAEHSHFENCLCADAIWSGLQPEREFWNALETPDVLRIREYFGKDVPGTVASGLWRWLRELNSASQPMCHTIRQASFPSLACHPLRRTQALNVRPDAGEDLVRVPGFLQLFEVRCAKFSDLECIMSRIHVGSCKTVVLGAFQSKMDITKQLKSYSNQFESRKLISILEELPDLTSIWRTFTRRLDIRWHWRKDIVPFAGFTGDFDANNDALKQLDSELEAHLDKARNELKSLGVV